MSLEVCCIFSIFGGIRWIVFTTVCGNTCQSAALRFHMVLIPISLIIGLYWEFGNCVDTSQVQVSVHPHNGVIVESGLHPWFHHVGHNFHWTIQEVEGVFDIHDINCSLLIVFSVSPSCHYFQELRMSS